VHRPILLLAEWGDLKFHRFGFDLTYSWDSYSRLKAVWKGAAADSFVTREVADLQAMPSGGARLRFSTNHDETAWDQPPVILFGGAPGARAAFVAATLLPGRPLLYNGQEVESPQHLPLFEKQPVAWNQADTLTPRAFYRRVLRIADTDSMFLSGQLTPVATDAPRDVIAYGRGGAVVLVNARNQAVKVTVSGFAVNGARDLLSDGRLSGDTVALAPYGAVVLEH
jgi:hypothetical protein